MMKPAQVREWLESRHFKEDYVPAEEQVLFKIDGRVIGTLGNFVTYSGLAKAGKSTFLSSTIASAYSEWGNLYGLELKPLADRPVICYIDTESSEYDFYRTINKIKLQANIKTFDNKFNAFQVREDTPETIRFMLEQYLTAFPTCSILIIDGLLDILNNFNDEIESKKTIQFLKYLTKKFNILLIGVIHLARKEQGGLLGHYGAFLERYSQSVLQVEKHFETGILQLKPKFLRSDKDFLPICLNWTPYGFEKCLPPADDNKKAAKK